MDRVTQLKLHHEVEGSGPTVVFVHEAIVDSRVWDPQWSSFEAYRRIRLDLRGFGRTPVGQLPLTHARDVVELLDGLGVSGAALVGGSMGARVVLEVAIVRPDLVGALVLVAMGLPGLDWSDEVQVYGEAEDEAVLRGDLDEATEVNLRMWVDGLGRKPADVDPGVREAVRVMQRQALELQAPVWEQLSEERLVEDIGGRLSEVRVPTLVVVGDEDVADIHRVAERLVREIPGARSSTIPRTAHVPHLERPADFDALVLGFLAPVFA
jgi:pimeloyl-ACP methyl ester carboxylesterase